VVLEGAKEIEDIGSFGAQNNQSNRSSGPLGKLIPGHKWKGTSLADTFRFFNKGAIV